MAKKNLAVTPEDVQRINGTLRALAAVDVFVTDKVTVVLNQDVEIKNLAGHVSYVAKKGDACEATLKRHGWAVEIRDPLRPDIMWTVPVEMEACALKM